MSKHLDGKYRPSLVYRSLISEVAAVRAHGAEKYGSTETWGENPPEYHLDAALRHLLAHLSGELRDPESGLKHLAHAASNLMFELERFSRNAERRKVLGSDRDFKEVVIKCPRCGSEDQYTLFSVLPCSNGCGYWIDSWVETQKQSSRRQ